MKPLHTLRRMPVIWRLHIDTYDHSCHGAADIMPGESPKAARAEPAIRPRGAARGGYSPPEVLGRSPGPRPRPPRTAEGGREREWPPRAAGGGRGGEASGAAAAAAAAAAPPAPRARGEHSVHATRGGRPAGRGRGRGGAGPPAACGPHSLPPWDGRGRRTWENRESRPSGRFSRPPRLSLSLSLFVF